MPRVWSNELERKRLLQLAFAWYPSIAAYRWLHGGDFGDWDDLSEEQKIAVVHAYLIRNHNTLEDIFAAPDLVDDTGSTVNVSKEIKSAASNLQAFSAADLNAMFMAEFGINPPSATTEEPAEPTSLPLQPEED